MSSPAKNSQSKKKKKPRPVMDKAPQNRPPPEDDEEENKEKKNSDSKSDEKKGDSKASETTTPPTTTTVPIVENQEEKEKKKEEKVEEKEKKVEEKEKKEVISIAEPEHQVEEKKGFPQSLGPFGIKQTGFKGSAFNISWGSAPNEGGMFYMDQAAFSYNPSLKALAKYIRDWPVIGQFSPSHPITLNPSAKKAALIPANAGSFVWSYPVAIQIDPSKSKGIDFTDPDIAFLTVGGYVYFDDKKAVCGVNTIIPATTGLQFSKPIKWNSSWTPYLAKDGRFQSITIKPLNDCGAWYFCWIRPDEPIYDTMGREHKICPNGGFVYLFHQKVFEATPDEYEKDCYFHVLSGEEYKKQVEAEAKYAKQLKAGKSPSSDKPGQKAAPAYFPTIGMVDQLNELFDAQNKLNEDRKRVEQEEKDVVDGATRKLVFLDKPINTWTIEMVGIWLDSVEFHSYKDIFRQQMVDGETLLDLDEQTIKTLVKVIHVKKMLRAVDRLRMQQQANQAVRKTIEDQKTLEERIDELKSQIETARTCVLCIDQDKNVKFNCGHVVTCLECGAKLKECPVCRIAITKREKVYLS
jgi:hypothetical protein